jgi:hypothetical protein
MANGAHRARHRADICLGWLAGLVTVETTIRDVNGSNLISGDLHQVQRHPLVKSNHAIIKYSPSGTQYVEACIEWR